VQVRSAALEEFTIDYAIYPRALSKTEATIRHGGNEPALMKKKPEKPQLRDDPEFDAREIEDAEFASQDDERAPELDPRNVELTTWDEPPSSSGTAAPKVGMEDEIPPGEQLVEEGIDEADREQRLAAADPDYEP
jgi:hypothetical protein